MIKKYKDILFLLLLSLVPLLWYGLDSDKLIVSHDVGYPFNPIELIKMRIFAWNSSIDFGVSQLLFSGTAFYHGIEAVFTFLFGSVFAGQRIYVIVWFLLPMLAMYEVLKRINVFSSKPYMALLAAVLYQFNHFQLQGWGVFWRMRFTVYTSLPILFLLTIDYLEGRRKLFKTSVLIGLVVFIFNGGGSPPLFGPVIILIRMILVYYFLFNSNSLRISLVFVKKVLLFSIITAVISIIFSLFWALPFYYFGAQSYGNIISAGGGPTGLIGWAEAVSANASILNLLRLQGVSSWTIEYAPSFFKIFLTNPLVIIAGFSWPILAFSSLFFAKQKDEKKYLLFFAILAFIAIIFSAGSHEPFRSFYIFALKNVPIFPMFRTPFYKFASLLWFSYSVLIAFSLSTIIGKIKDFLATKKIYTAKPTAIIAGLFFSGILLWNYPIFSDVFFHWNPLYGLSTIEKIPKYVIEAGKYFDTHNNWQTKSFVVPEVNSAWSVEIYKWGYFSATTVNSFLTAKNFISNDSNLIGGEKTIINGFYNLLKKNDKRLFNIMPMLGIDSILLRNDSYYDLPGAPSTPPFVYKNVMDNTKDKIQKVISFGEWDYYKLLTPPSPKLFLLTNTVYSTMEEDNYLQLFLFLDNIGINLVKGFVTAPFSHLINPMDRNNNLVVAPQPVSYLLPVEKEEFTLFKPKVLPNSPFYFFVETKEKELKRETSKPEELVNLYLGFSLKRLSELNGLIKLYSDVQEDKEVVDRFNTALNEVRENINLMKENSQEQKKLILRSREFIAKERNFLAQLINGQKNIGLKSLLENTYKSSGDILRSLKLPGETDKFTGMDKIYNDANLVILTPIYKWTIPQGGKFQAYLNKESILANSKQLIIKIDEKKVRSIQSVKDNNGTGWKKIGEVDLDKGEHGLQIEADGIPVYSFKKGDLIFFKKQPINYMSNNGAINYIRINPTRYKVEISSGGKPFTLVFNERFDKDWKAYLIPKSEMNFFNTLWLKPVPENKHIKVNGYANAWYVDGLNNQDIIIEYWPQRLLPLGYGISFIAVGAGIIYLWIVRKR